MKIEKFEEAYTVIREIEYLKRQLLDLDHVRNLNSIVDFIERSNFPIEVPKIDALKSEVKNAIENKIKEFESKFNSL
jgi:hypothetical protein